MSIGGRLAAGRRPFRGWSAGVEIIFMRMYVSSMCHFLRRLVVRALSGRFTCGTKAFVILLNTMTRFYLEFDVVGSLCV